MTMFVFGIINRKYPFGVVIHPEVVPLIITLAPGKGFPDPASVTLPLIDSFSCPKREMDKQRVKIEIIRNRINSLFILSTKFSRLTTLANYRTPPPLWFHHFNKAVVGYNFAIA